MTVELLADPVPVPVEQEWPPQRQWTYADYRRLPDDGWTYEVIEGELLMAPAPRTIHQRVSYNLTRLMGNFVETHKPGRIYYAPVDVLLTDLASPVQPDVLFIARDRLHIIKEDNIEGAPDLIVEILSPGNWIVDRRRKFRIYAQAGVREYWIVDSTERSVEVYVLRGQSYELLDKYGADEVVGSEVLAGFEVKVGEICPAK